MTVSARRSQRRRLVAIVVVVLAGLATHGTYAGTGDEPHYLAIAHSIAFDFDLDLSNNYGTNAPLIGGGGIVPEAHVRPGVGGIARPVHDIGMPLLFAPYVRIAAPLAAELSAVLPPSLLRRFRVNSAIIYRHLISLAMVGLAAALAVLLFDATSSFWGALIVVLSPPLLIHSILFFTEVTTALLAFAVFRAVAADALVLLPRRALLLGAATGLLMLIHARAVGLAAALVVITTLRLLPASKVSLVAFACGLFVLVAIRTFFVHHFWGTWISSPIAHPGEWVGWGHQFREASGRLGGLIADRDYGLLWYAPVFLLAPYGFVLLARRRQEFAWRALFVISGYLVALICPLLNPYGMAGGWSPAARFLVPVSPFLGLGVAAAMTDGPRVLVLPLVVIQLMLDAYVWQHPKVLWHLDRTNVTSKTDPTHGIVSACLDQSESLQRTKPS